MDILGAYIGRVGREKGRKVGRGRTEKAGGERKPR